VYVTDTSTFTSNIHTQGYDGLLGLGPNDGSVIKKKLKTGGDTLLQRIFGQNHDTDNYISFLLDRKNDPSDPFKGQFSIGEAIPGFENITTFPKLDVETVNRLLKAGELDGFMGLKRLLIDFCRPTLASSNRRGQWHHWT